MQKEEAQLVFELLRVKLMHFEVWDTQMIEKDFQFSSSDENSLQINLTEQSNQSPFLVQSSLYQLLLVYQQLLWHLFSLDLTMNDRTIGQQFAWLHQLHYSIVLSLRKQTKFNFVFYLLNYFRFIFCFIVWYNFICTSKSCC